MKIALVLFVGITLCSPGMGQDFKTQNLILITYDGLRWQELFTGVDTSLLHDPSYTAKGALEELTDLFWDENPSVSRKRLLPFFWTTFKENGQLYGNRNLGSKVNVTNSHWFSYPGYSEILCGFSDDERISSNQKLPNPNQTVLEFVEKDVIRM